MLKPIAILMPNKISFGKGSSSRVVEDLHSEGYKRIFIVAFPGAATLILTIIKGFEKNNMEVEVNYAIDKEPDSDLFNKVFDHAHGFSPDAVVGFGGGSVMDTAKLIAALLFNYQSPFDLCGLDKLKKRHVELVCIPTTSGTGSEVSPNAILIDTTDNKKKAVISPVLIPDKVYIDPELTVTLSPFLTAITGLDALCHCIEGYTNKYSHPMVDIYALEGIRLIGRNLLKVVDSPDDLEAREAMSLGSYYGGLCLGPVNTTAVHALAYPLGSEYHISHGLANAVLLPHVMRFNYNFAIKRYAEVATAIGAKVCDTEAETALEGIEIISDIIKMCRIPSSLRELNIPESSIPDLAKSALTVQRLLMNNIRDVNLPDAINIYESAY